MLESILNSPLRFSVAESASCKREASHVLFRSSNGQEHYRELSRKCIRRASRRAFYGVSRESEPISFP
jgi:hypothetical protein